jgi:hypothetical protein
MPVALSTAMTANYTKRLFYTSARCAAICTELLKLFALTLKVQQPEEHVLFQVTFSARRTSAAAHCSSVPVS